MLKAQLLQHALVVVGGIGVFKRGQGRVEIGGWHDQLEGLLQRLEVHLADDRLVAIAVASGVVEIGGGKARVVAIDKGVGAVVKAFAGDRHVVGVEYGMAKAHGHPLGGQAGDAIAQLLVEMQIPLLGIGK